MNTWLDKEDLSMLLMLVSSNSKVFDNYKNGKEYQEQLRGTLMTMRTDIACKGYPKDDAFKDYR
tara:strand:+ start:361 stop:552 length:192 start_codon:yes stop_codon:yes gene_type:complete